MSIIANAVLESTIAGSWYPGTKEALSSTIGEFLSKADGKTVVPPPNVIIVPHAGYAYSGLTAASAYKLAGQGDFDKVILLAPSHRVYLRDMAILPVSDGASTPLGVIRFDDAVRGKLLSNSRFFKADDRVHEYEHSTQIQYPFLQSVLKKDFTLLPVIVGLLSEQSAKEIGSAIAEAADERTLVVVSSDFTHYGKDFSYVPFRENVFENVRKVDMGAFEKISSCRAGDFLRYIDENSATICGSNPIAVMMNMVEPDTKFELVKYATSSDESGDTGHFVCYLAACARTKAWRKRENVSFVPSVSGLTSEDKKSLLAMARKSIEYVFAERRLPPDDLFASKATDAMKKTFGAFVTLTVKDTGALRGCIGEIEGFRPLYQAVTARACDAAFRDPRFYQLRQSELSNVRIEISVLTPYRKVASYKDIVIGKHGMTLSLGNRSAVFLPQVAVEQGWDLAQTLTALSQKAGLPPDAWQDPAAEFTVFETDVFSE